MVEDEWILPDISREGVLKSYSEEYENQGAGLIQELGQNSFDAYPLNTDPSNMKIIIQYNADERVLSWRDFNSTGMSHCNDCDWGIDKTTGNPCKNRNCDWSMYHNIARSGKSGLKLGSRGLGKSLPLQSGKELNILTKTIDNKAMASIWKRIEILKDEEEYHWKLDKTLSPDQWNQSGTEVRIINTFDKIHSYFLDVNQVIIDIQNRWRNMIDKGAHITFMLINNGKKVRRVIKPFKEIVTMESLKDTTNPLKIPSEYVKLGGKIIGEMRNIQFGLSKDPFDEDDPRFGIALVKNGIQTIDIIKDVQNWRKIPDELRYRIYGSIDIICTQERPFLNEAEKATHTGYRNHPYFTQVKRQINDRLKRFIEPYIIDGKTKKGIQPITRIEKADAEDIKEIWNVILSDIPELNNFWEGGGKGDQPLPPPENKDFPYVSRIEFENKKWKIGDSVPLKAIIKNPMQKEITLNVQWELRDTAPVTIQEQKDPILLRGGKLDNPYTFEVNWRVNINNSMIPGMYGIRVSLLDSFDNSYKDSNGNIYPQTKMTRVLYIEEEPIVIKRKPRTRGGKGKGRPKEIIKKVVPFRDPDDPDYECSFEKGIMLMRINLEGRRYKYLTESSQHLDRKRKWLPFFEAGANEIAFEKALWDIDENNITDINDSQNLIKWIADVFEIEKKILSKYIEHYSKNGN